MKAHLRQILYLAAALGLVAGLFGCGNSSSNPQMASFEVQLTNLTANQPLSPMAAVLHGSGFSAWQLGTGVSDGLEQLAEGGDPTAFLAAATAAATVRSSLAGSGLVLPGGSDTLTLTGLAAGARLTLASMLVNTNDAFTGIADQSLTSLQIGQALSLDLRSYDAGTEANSETAASVPGLSGTGYAALRDDRDFVTQHSGVVSVDDGLITSALDESHRFQNPAARLVITRIQ